MIEIVLKTQHRIYDYLFDKIKYISTRFLESQLTPKKTQILESFKHYCLTNAENGMSRTELVEGWHRNYVKHNDENPFDTLKLHRRIFQGFLSIFNPDKTESIKLFEKYLKNEVISDYLKESMYSCSASIPTDTYKLLV
ncbi:hypothetical protein ACFORL_08790 [Legionella dresdenensis]|uniref:Uncharacterized protein n=1 Tax=Legionella dresdenensis TaxID=450200 RepID=A0ABV8CGN8_9GAMM